MLRRGRRKGEGAQGRGRLGGEGPWGTRIISKNRTGAAGYNATEMPLYAVTQII
jgi:hypothetical protein